MLVVQGSEVCRASATSAKPVQIYSAQDREAYSHQTLRFRWISETFILPVAHRGSSGGDYEVF